MKFWRRISFYIFNCKVFLGLSVGRDLVSNFLLLLEIYSNVIILENMLELFCTFENMYSVWFLIYFGRYILKKKKFKEVL